MPIVPFNPEDYPGKVCCGALEHLYTSGYLFPFVKSDIHDLWMVRLYEQDGRTLDLNTMRYTHIALVYCPFCGKKLYDERRSQSI